MEKWLKILLHLFLINFETQKSKAKAFWKAKPKALNWPTSTVSK
jgi:hypothetical protein